MLEDYVGPPALTSAARATTTAGPGEDDARSDNSALVGYGEQDVDSEMADA